MKRHFIIYVIIVVLILAGCTNDKNTDAVTKSVSDLYGKYLLEKQIYKNPSSSFFVGDGYKEYYTFAENMLIVTGEGGNHQEFEVTYEKAVLDENEFRSGY